MEAPRVDPVGLVRIPTGYETTPRSYSRGLRLTALLVVGAFTFVGIATTVATLGLYCLTTDAGAPVRWGP